MTELKGKTVIIYSKGLCHCSVCAPKDLSVEEVVAEVNLIYPTGIFSNWSPSEDKTFATGDPNPCVCQDDPNRLHYLLDC